MDFIPRIDVLSTLEYYDKYFKELPVYESADKIEVAKQKPDFGHSSSVISRLLRSPFAYETTIEDAEGNAIESAVELFKAHLHRWVTFTQRKRDSMEADRSLPPFPESALVNKHCRDENLHQLLIDDDKYRLAMMFGADFAPMATSIAEASVGPRFSDII